MRILHVILEYIRALFLRVLGILYTHRSLIKWPDRETLSIIMRTSFKIFVRKCAAIIDCLEVFIEMPSNLLTRAQVWSNYKHHNTIEFLIEITPQGIISYMSQCVVGQISDKEIAEQSQLINHLLQGKVNYTQLYYGWLQAVFQEISYWLTGGLHVRTKPGW